MDEICGQGEEQGGMRCGDRTGMRGLQLVHGCRLPGPCAFSKHSQHLMSFEKASTAT